MATKAKQVVKKATGAAKLVKKAATGAAKPVKQAATGAAKSVKQAAKAPAAKAVAKPAATAKPPAAKAAKPTAKAPAAKTRKPAKGGAYSAATVEQTFGVTLPPRYRAFLDSGEYQQHNGKFASKIPSLAGKRQVIFDAPKLLTVFRVNGVKVEGKIPLAAFTGNSGVLTIDISDPACPVGLWDEGAFLKFHPSLDALLGSLRAAGEASPAEALEEATKAAGKLIKAEQFAKGLALIDKAIGKHTPASVGDAKNELAGALNVRARALTRLDRKSEALIDYETSVTCGPGNGHRASLMLCDHYIDAREGAKVLALVKALIASEGQDIHTRFWQELYLGVAYVLVGDEAAAKAAMTELASNIPKDGNGLREKVRSVLGEAAPKSPLLKLFVDKK